MAPTPHRIAHTSTELKRQHRKNGSLLNERQRKQLARELELNQRAAQAREAEERRKAAAKKRKEKEAKEAAARKQLGVGLATQLIGYSHTQAQLKNGMEAFLGLSKKKDAQRRQRELELTKKLEETVATIEKEPWDDDDDDDDDAPDLAEPNASLGEQWADDDLDDASLLEAHNLVVSDLVEESSSKGQPQPAPVSHTAIAPPLASNPSKPILVKEDPEFTRTHGPINKTIEAALDKLPGPLIELLSQDISLKTPEWDPAVGLLHKLNPVGLPQHRLRIKVGCVVTLLKDLNTSSQLSKSQHVQILRSENERLECLVLDGQLRGTKTFLTRVSFHAKYKNLDQHSFQRTQFPICVALGYRPSQPLPETSQAGFKVPSVQGRIPPTILPRKPTPPATKVKSPAIVNPVFKLPGLPASKSNCSDSLNTTPAVPIPHTAPPLSSDCWDDFFESSTQISREIASEENSKVIKTSSILSTTSPPTTDDLPPVSTQDLDFSLDDLTDDFDNTASGEVNPRTASVLSKKLSAPVLEKAASQPMQEMAKMVPVVPPVRSLTTSSIRENGVILTHTPTRSSAVANSSRPLASTKKIAGKCWNPGPFVHGLEIELSKLRASQLPKSMSGPSAKRKATAVPSKDHAPPPKRPCTADSRPIFPLEKAATIAANTSFNDFIMSTQDAESFFDDDENLSFGSPPIAV